MANKEGYLVLVWFDSNQSISALRDHLQDKHDLIADSDHMLIYNYNTKIIRECESKIINKAFKKFTEELEKLRVK